jgi:16S rRNA (guanine527-N7)-methyltransferase
MNPEEREIFIMFLRKLGLDEKTILTEFELYHSLLLEANKRVNLISRQTSPDEIWTRHFCDSLLPMALGYDFTDKVILDLGTGGGLPGICLAILNRHSKFILLDSREKKILELKRIIKKLDLKNCYPISYRLEEINWDLPLEELPDLDGIDIVVCRSVKITGKLLTKIRRVIKQSGYILLYKGKEVNESWLLEEAQAIHYSREIWGNRTILHLLKV